MIICQADCYPRFARGLSLGDRYPDRLETILMTMVVVEIVALISF